MVATEQGRSNSVAMAARNSGALAETASGELNAAIAQYTEALRLEPRRSEAHYNLGNVLAQRGDLDDAINHYREPL